MSIDVQSTLSVPALQYERHEPVNIDLLNPLPSPLQVKSQSIKTAPVHVLPPRKWEPPVSAWKALCHPRVDEVSREVDGYFLKHWNFSNAKAEKTFLKAGFSRVTSLYFPMAKYDRIHFACRLLSVLFLIDGNTHIPLIESYRRQKVEKKKERQKSISVNTEPDVLEDMSFAEGEVYNEKLIPIARGDVSPDRLYPM